MYQSIRVGWTQNVFKFEFHVWMTCDHDDAQISEWAAMREITYRNEMSSIREIWPTSSDVHKTVIAPPIISLACPIFFPM